MTCSHRSHLRLIARTIKRNRRLSSRRNLIRNRSINSTGDLFGSEANRSRSSGLSRERDSALVCVVIGNGESLGGCV